MIPVIQVRRLAAEKRYEGTLSFSFPPEEDLLDLPFVSFLGDADVDLGYSISENGAVDVEGSLSFTLTGQCSRCLSPAEQRFTGEVRGVFEEGEGDGETYGYDRGTVRLEELLRDSVLFALPHLLLCKDCAEQEENSK